MSAHPIETIFPSSTWHFIEDKFSPLAKDLLAKVVHFVINECQPAAELYHAQISEDPIKRWQSVPPIVEELKKKAKAQGLWNLFLSKRHYPDVGTDLTNLEYAVMAEVMGRGHHFTAEAMNCSAPDTGNMEVLAKYGNAEQKKTWLTPLLNGEIRSAFAMTEPGLASSDATNIQLSIRQEGEEIVLNGRKWWISGAGDPRCALHLVMGKSDPNNTNRHRQQSLVIVPSNTPGIKVIRPMKVFGYDDAPEGHCEISYENVRVPLKNLVKGWGAGFEIIQGRLGPGRIHHCMRSIGVAEQALDRFLLRATDQRKKAFGKTLSEHGTIVAGIAMSRMEINQARLLVLNAANEIDRTDAKGAMRDIGMSKVIVPSMALQVIDRSMQAHGAEGISQDTDLAQAWSQIRTLRYADGPDEVHIQQIGKMELRRAKAVWETYGKRNTKSEALLSGAGLKAHL